MNNGEYSEEETTSTGKLRSLRTPPRADAPKPVDDLHVAVGQLMGGLARAETSLRELQSLPREVAQLRRDIELDRSHLVRRAARRSSNRLALLVSGLFVLYDQAAPVLHAIWKGLNK